MACKIFIDESGEAGISKIRSETSGGASPYFVLAAAVMPSAAAIHASSVLKDVNKRFSPKKWGHATDLNHSQTVYWARNSTQVNLRFFAVVSNKSTLGDYAKLIENSPDKFYNKCAVYLLERVGKYLSAKGLATETPDIIFERRNHDYDALRRYIGKIKDNPLHEDARYLSIFNPFAIVARGKDEDPLLKYADIAAYSVYQCVNKAPTNYGIPEPRYLDELSKKFGADENGNILGAGIKCIHSLDQLMLDDEIKSQLLKMRARPMIPNTAK